MPTDYPANGEKGFLKEESSVIPDNGKELILKFFNGPKVNEMQISCFVYYAV